MLKIFKILLCMCFFLIIIFYLPSEVCAEEMFDDQYNAVDELLDSSSGGIMSSNDISVKNTDKFLKTDLKKIFRWLSDRIYEEIAAPFKLLILLLSAVILSSVAGNLYDESAGRSFAGTGEITGVLICVSVLFEPVSRCFEQTAEIVSDGSKFMLSYIPVMSGIMAAQGNVTSAGSYQLILITFCELAVRAASLIFIPCLSTCFSVSIVDSINPDLSLSGLINGIRKTVIFLTGMIMTFFTGILTIRESAGNAADTLAVRTGKYLVSSAVPVIGKAVTDAYSAVRGGLGVMRTSIGTAGVAVVLLMLVPPVIRLFLFRAAVSAANIAADIFSCGRLKKLFSDMEQIFGIIIGIVISFIIMLIVATVTVMRFETGV